MCFPVAGADPVGQALAPLGKRTPDSLRLGLPGHACHFGGEPLDLIVLDVQRHVNMLHHFSTMV
jgi:hypothetical protein